MNPEENATTPFMLFWFKVRKLPADLSKMLMRCQYVNVRQALSVQVTVCNNQVKVSFLKKHYFYARQCGDVRKSLCLCT